MSAIFEKLQQLSSATPTPINWSVILGSLFMSILQPLAVIITVTWGCLQIHGYVERRWNRDFLWLNKLFGKKK